MVLLSFRIRGFVLCSQNGCNDYTWKHGGHSSICQDNYSKSGFDKIPSSGLGRGARLAWGKWPEHDPVFAARGLEDFHGSAGQVHPHGILHLVMSRGCFQLK